MSLQRAINPACVFSLCAALICVCVAAEGEKLSATHPPLIAGDHPLGDIGQWYVLDVIETTTDHGTVLTKQSDGSMLAEGDAPDRETYTVVMSTNLRRIAAFKLEVLADESFPRNGPGRATNGNFTLTGLELTQAPHDKPDGAARVKLSAVAADYEQRDYEAAGAFDDGDSTGWSIGNGGADHWLVFKPEAPLPDHAQTRLTFTFKHLHPQRERYTIGRFRISATTAPLPPPHTDAPAFQPPLVKVGYAPATIADLQSSNGSSAAPSTDNDGSLLVTGEAKPDDTYTLRIETQLTNITGVMLEALPDPSLPRGGPGRMAGGRFSVGHVTLTAATKEKPDEPQPVTIVEAWADDEQPGLPVRNAIDSSPRTQWAAGSENAKPVKAVFLTDKPIGHEEGTVLTLTLAQRTPIGRLRVALSTARQRHHLIPSVEKQTPVVVTEEAQAVEHYFNLAGTVHVDPQGRVWMPMRKWRDGREGYVGGAPVRNFLIKDPILNSGQSGIDGVRVPLQPGRYKVALIFAEPRENTEPGYREFDVGVEGRAVMRGLDPVRATGGIGRAYVHVLPSVPVEDGTLDIDFMGTKPILNGLLIQELKGKK